MLTASTAGSVASAMSGDEWAMSGDEHLSREELGREERLRDARPTRRVATQRTRSPVRAAAAGRPGRRRRVRRCRVRREGRGERPFQRRQVVGGEEAAAAVCARAICKEGGRG